MLENHSFDQMLGDFQSKYPDLDGIDPAAPPRTNVDLAGNVYKQAPTTARSVNPDPKHELDHVLRQIEADAPIVDDQKNMHRIRRGLVTLFEIGSSWLFQRKRQLAGAGAAPYQGAFVMDYAESYATTSVDERQAVMGYYKRGSLPALHSLAENFTICDRWFASVPGPTWTNRFFVHTGTSLGIARMPDHKWDVRNYDLYDQATIYDRLNARGIPWRIYYHDVPQSLALTRQLLHENKRCYSEIDRLEVDAAGSETDFPMYSFIEPQYLEPDPNDDHPPYDIFAAQRLIARVYNAIRANEPLWQSTLLVLLYDEHGGFYDHVRPPTAAAPDNFQNEYSFDQLGVRVPALLVSPWVDAGVCHTELDHTSLLRYVCDLWNLEPLGIRAQRAKSFADAIRQSGKPRTDTPKSIPSNPPMMAAAAAPGPSTAPRRNENQESLENLSRVLEARVAAKAVGAPAAAVSAQTDSDAAAKRVQRFLETD